MLNKKIANTLSLVGNIFDKEDINWVVGGSIILEHYGITDIVNDIDIIVDIIDFEKVVSLLKPLGDYKLKEATKLYKTEKFAEFNIDNVEIDIMSNFKIVHSKGKYEYELNEKSIGETILINNIEIPLGTLEDWYEIYQAIPGREEKVELIKEYLDKA